MTNESSNKNNYDNHNYNTRTNDNALITFSRLSKNLKQSHCFNL